MVKYGTQTNKNVEYFQQHAVLNRYVSRCLLIDNQTHQRYYFLCSEWLADDIGDGRIDRTFKESTLADLRQKSQLFFSYANK